MLRISCNESCGSEADTTGSGNLPGLYVRAEQSVRLKMLEGIKNYFRTKVTPETLREMQEKTVFTAERRRKDADGMITSLWAGALLLYIATIRSNIVQATFFKCAAGLMFFMFMVFAYRCIFNEGCKPEKYYLKMVFMFAVTMATLMFARAV